MAQCTNRKELLQCSNIALNEIQTYQFNKKGLLIPAKPYALATNSLVIISIRPERCGRSTIIVRHSLMIAMRIIRIIMSEQHLIGKAIHM